MAFTTSLAQEIYDRERRLRQQMELANIYGASHGGGGFSQVSCEPPDPKPQKQSNKLLLLTEE